MSEDDLVPLGVSVAVSLAVAGYVAVAFPQVGAWAWLAVAAPVAVHVADLVGSRRRRQRRLRRGVSTRGSLEGADLSRAQLASRSLRHRDLSSARLVDASLTGADLSRAELSDARFHRADLSGASLHLASCERAVFYRADLTGADLDRVRAGDASFEQAILCRATLVGADLRGVDFDGADARGADFSRAEMDADALAGATVDSTTILSDGRRARSRRQARQRDLDGRIDWRAGVAGSTGLAAWPVLRSLLVGLAGAVTVAGGATVTGDEGDDLAQGAASSVEVAQTRGADPGRREPAEGDRDEVLRQFGVTEPSSTEVAAAAAALDRARDQDSDRASPEPESSEPRLPDPGLPPTETTGGPAGDSAGDSTDDLAEVGEVPSSEVLGLVVERGLQIVVDSEGGTSTASFDSPIGATSLTVYEEQRYDFDGAPAGTVSVVITPDGDEVVATCAVTANGARQTNRGLPGQAVTCEVAVTDKPTG